MKTHPNIHRADPPSWFKQSYFGIFIHWGLYSIPAFTPVDVADYDSIIRNESPEAWFAQFPYAEWYQNGLRIEGSPVQNYHREHYGQAAYAAFAEEFKAVSRAADVNAWADMFQTAGASYVVLVTKHHDGFVLWDTDVKNPRQPGYHLDFDFVGQPAEAVRARGMRFGLYYSSLLDWTFTETAITSPADLFLDYDRSPTYRKYVQDHWHELIDRYKPDILWNDIGYPHEGDLLKLFEYYYRAVPEGIVNDRWTVLPSWLHNRLGKKLVNRFASRLLKSGDGKPLDAKYYDYRTIEYSTVWNDPDTYVEMCRGIDKSFAHNRYSKAESFISAAEIREIVAELKPKKGRLLLGVGPTKAGKIPDAQRQVLADLTIVSRKPL